MAVGSREFLQRVKALAKGEARQKELFARVCSERSWESIKGATSHAKGEPWEQFVNRHGDSGRNIALLIARKLGRFTLSQLGREVGISESAVAHAVGQAERLIREDPKAMKLFRFAADYSSFKT